jgi:hypothetical protein
MQSSQAMEAGFCSMLLLGAVVVHDDPAMLWLEQNWRRLVLIGMLGFILQLAVMLLNGFPGVRVTIGRLILAFMGAAALSTVSGAMNSAGSGVLATTLCIVFGGIASWMLVYSIDAGLSEYRESGDMQKAVMAAISGGLARFIAPRPIPTHPSGTASRTDVPVLPKPNPPVVANAPVTVTVEVPTQQPGVPVAGTAKPMIPSDSMGTKEVLLVALPEVSIHLPAVNKEGGNDGSPGSRRGEG